MATIRDVAEAAGVSTATVSNVLNNKKKVNPETRERVLAAVDALGFRINAVAKSLKNRKTNRIAIVVTDLAGQFFQSVIRSVNAIADDNGYSLSIFNSDRSVSKEKDLLREILSAQYDGVLLDTVISTAQIPEYAEYLRRLFLNSDDDKFVPLTILERDFSSFGFDSVCVDIYEGGQSAMRHLYDLGCRRIAFLSPPPNFDERIRAYYDSLDQFGLKYDPRLEEATLFSYFSGYTAMQKIIGRQVSFDGLFCGNDEVAVGAYQAMKESGISIPGDVRVIGFDNIFLDNIMSPSLSSINVPKSTMGRVAAENLFKRIEDGHQELPVKVQLPTQLVIRKSTEPNAILSNDWIRRI